PLEKANQQRRYSTDENKARIQLLVSSYRRQGLNPPTTKEMAAELGLTVRRVQQLRKELGIVGKPGRPKKNHYCETPQAVNGAPHPAPGLPRPAPRTPGA